MPRTAKKKPRRLFAYEALFGELKVSALQGEALTGNHLLTGTAHHCSGNQFISGQSRPFKIPRAMGKSNQDGDRGGEIRHEH